MKDKEEEVQEPEVNQFQIDIDNLPKVTHHWIDRGMKMTCENAGHPYHEAWKIGK
jgi:hypothetical protein